MANDTLTATATKTDADGDAVTLTYVWKVNGTIVKTTANTTSLTDTRSLIGTITFDSNGHYSFTGQQVIGNTAAAAEASRVTT